MYQHFPTCYERVLNSDDPNFPEFQFTLVICMFNEGNTLPSDS